MAARKHFLRPTEFDHLRRLRDKIGITKLALVLDLPFYTCRSMLDVERVSDRTLQRVRDHLPAAIARYLVDCPDDDSSARSGREPLQPANVDVQATLATLLPYVSVTRLAHALGISLGTVKAAAAGYRRMHAATAEAFRTQLDVLLQPPYDALRSTLRASALDGAVEALRTGVLAPIEGLTAEETETLLVSAARG